MSSRDLGLGRNHGKWGYLGIRILFVALLLGLITLSIYLDFGTRDMVDKYGGLSIKAKLTVEKSVPTEINGRDYPSPTLTPTKSPSQYSLNPRRNWYPYRLGDGVKRYDRFISDKVQVCRQFPGTILCEYLQRTAKKRDVSVLLDIVRDWSAGKWKFLKKPGVNSIVLHLRLGDGLCRCHDDRVRCKASNKTLPNCWENVGSCYTSSGNLLYAYPKEYYELVAKDLLESVGRNSTIVIVADPSHIGSEGKKCAISIDMAYRDYVRSFFQSKGFLTQIYELTGIPDYDFVYMSLAQYFVRGGGGFSKDVAEVVTAGGGKVFEPRIMSDN